jgi:ComF family protein
MPPDRPVAARPASTSASWRRWLGALPRPCALCSQWDRAGFCSDCRQRFIDTPAARCPRCALPTPGGQVCGACLQAPPPFARTIALADYAFPWDRLIARFKFQQQPELAGSLADALVAAVQRAPTLPEAPLVLPVPLSPARLAERGYNQAWELARQVARTQGLRAHHGALLRLRDTPHQVGLSRQARATNLHDAMWVPPEGRALITGRQVALVDDVMTTGMTASAATQALLAAGAASVQVWVLARTPAPQN